MLLTATTESLFQSLPRFSFACRVKSMSLSAPDNMGPLAHLSSLHSPLPISLIHIQSFFRVPDQALLPPICCSVGLKCLLTFQFLSHSYSCFRSQPTYSFSHKYLLTLEAQFMAQLIFWFLSLHLPYPAITELRRTENWTQISKSQTVILSWHPAGVAVDSLNKQEGFTLP